MVLSNLVVAGVALLAAANLPAVQAQATSNATCLPQFQWMINSKQQTPCLASAYLSAQCNGGQWNVPALTGTQPYNNPTGSAANLCRCNTVTYNLLQACSYCQGANIGGWLDWTTNCTAANTTVGSYPLPLPGGVAVPNWAYLDFTQQDRFLPDVAQQAAGTSPESVSGAAGTQIQTSYTGGSSATSAATTSGSATSTSLPQEGGSSSNTGAIAGGVVGGVLGLALFALLAWFLLRKKSDKPAAAPPMQETYPSQPYAGTTYSGPGYETGYPVQQPPYGTGPYTPVPGAQFDPYGGAPGTPYKPYDPSDPSTFPTTPGPGNAPTVHSGPYSEYSNGNNPQHQPRPGQYNYAAEI